jgi:hypothetical protein
MKKITAFLLLTFIPSVVFAASFPDVLENTVNYGAVEYLKSKNVISGYPNGNFEPEKTINRAEALKIVVNAAGLKTESQQAINFKDVSDSDWFSQFVKVGVEKGIVEGYEDNTFKPGNNINLAESLKIIILAFGLEAGAAPLKNPYPDVEAVVWYAKYANFAKSKQLIWPQDDGNLNAQRDITREEFAQIIYRLMFMKQNSLDSFPLSTDWPVFTDNKSGYSIKYPFGWVKIQAGTQTIFWKKDELNEQLSWARVYPNSATVVAAIDNNVNRLSLEKYLSLIKYDDSAQIQKSTLNGYPFASVSLISSGTYDYYFQMPNSAILVIYGQVGDGLNKAALFDQIRYMVGSVKHAEITADNSVTDSEKFLSAVRELILVSGKSTEALAMFDDLIIIDTDTIGIGTGPVDYHYSATRNVTLKVERTSSTLLAINEAKSTAF